MATQMHGQTAAASNELTRQPILRIEPGVHTAPIKRISVDSSDGTIVQFSYDEDGKSPAQFSIANRRLDGTASNTSALKLTLTTGLAITDWKDSYAPKLNGRTLDLKPNEMSRSLAVAPEHSCFLLGGDFLLRLYDPNGKEIWQAAIPGTAWSVNIYDNGELAAAALGDGTIRWYRMSDGKELLAFFPHTDRQRWVLWTPSGYYDCSPGAEELIGWHANNGKDEAADFFPVSKFRSTYYQPYVISFVLKLGDEFTALQRLAAIRRGVELGRKIAKEFIGVPPPPANEELERKRNEAEILKRLPPVISITTPADSSEFSSAAVTVRYLLRTPSGEPVTAVRAMVDGRPVATERLLKPVNGSDVRQLSLTIPERDCELALIAENKYAASVPNLIRLKWRGRDEFVIRPKLYVLAVGISQYAKPEHNLNFAAKDARDFAEVMKRQKGGLYREVVIKLLTDAQATRDEIADGLDWIRRETTSKDVAMVFLAGHGVNDNYGRYYFCPHNIDPDRMLRTGISFSDIKRTVESLAGKTVFFVDTCHSGNVMGGNAARNLGLSFDINDINGFINELTSAENGAVVFAASTSGQASLENKEWNNG
ncbi:MAG: caspase family protein, partial [Blastocatellia bacterium]